MESKMAFFHFVKVIANLGIKKLGYVLTFNLNCKIYYLDSL